ncbi:DUF4450 domain-containing protein [Niabella ginsengisoli]|uniref:DUF4450 domain-containing protein n=1 Tax=Niabella ginsengisoli TaxID=522298 RepID=A0ABS9SG64_9BACT|nr:DUF4450 domain-containing protein [Niabella ginsengisoli]MCH5597358.1 DUF4450 domain-containing protein [Niabella ginsengisoli]
MPHYIKYFLFTTLACLISLGFGFQAMAQLWHNKERVLHYKPSGTDFILHQGAKKFNRALYGTNTGFRVEAGDLPEFALYMPGMGGNCKIGILFNNQSKWITEADDIKTTYRPGAMLYEIKDKLLKNGRLYISVLAMAEEEGMILKLETKDVPANTSLIIAYGGATGKKFSRDGDIGADPESSFYLDPSYCKDNQYNIKGHTFQLYYGFTKPLTDDERYEIQYGKKPDSTKKDKPKIISGIFPLNSTVKLADAYKQESPLQLFKSHNTVTAPAIVASVKVENNVSYLLLKNNLSSISYAMLDGLFQKAEQARKKIANRVILETPDVYINPLGSALSIAADAIWEAPSYLHGSVAWRMRLPAWRGAYVADALGWHDRARLHFDSYLKSQVTNIDAGNIEPDTALHFARQKERMGNAMFSNGYICRNPDGKIQPHHYDMNLVFIDQLLTHLKYTGDISYVRKVWPSIKLHLQWEKRNYDIDDDGLYDAYACIWASDALQYSGGGVTHATAYNYRANKMAAYIAKLLKEDATAYETESAKILKALNQKLWLNEKGTFAENRDILGLKLAHSAPGLWTIYHAIDGGIATPAQQFQMLRYVDDNIPHIPVKAKDLPFNDLQLLSTTNWQPYTWSVNNVALAENLNTALAYWQSGENDNAFNLWKSSIVESMYLSSSPGGFQQLSFYDAVRGELYRDFADPIGVAARTLTEGLFGIVPDALSGSLYIHPGFPSDWRFAKLSLPNILFDFKASGNESVYNIKPRYSKQMNLVLRVNAFKNGVENVYINGKKAKYHWVQNTMHNPAIEINAGAQSNYEVKIIWSGNALKKDVSIINSVKGEKFKLPYSKLSIQKIDDIQDAFSFPQQGTQINELHANTDGNHNLLLHLKQGNATWIQPVSIHTKPAIEIIETETNEKSSAIKCINHTSLRKEGVLHLNNYKETFSIDAGATKNFTLSATHLNKGRNKIFINLSDGTSTIQTITNWDVPASAQYEPIKIDNILNDNITNTFKHKYLSPSATSTTLQIPWQGIGNWCYPLIQPEIAEAGIQKKAVYLDKIPFNIGTQNNIAYTSQWDQFPDSINIPLSGKSSHAYLLMAGTTNHQQSQMVNGIIYIAYTDGSKDSLELINPENWWPIEQDYMNDGFAFKTGAKPYRLILKTGELTRSYNDYTTIKGFTNMAIEGGAGTVLDIPLNPDKELNSLTFRTLTNEVLIGLMSLTLQRN